MYPFLSGDKFKDHIELLMLKNKKRRFCMNHFCFSNEEVLPKHLEVTLEINSIYSTKVDK